jgi:hypothetical protein
MGHRGLRPENSPSGGTRRGKGFQILHSSSMILSGINDCSTGKLGIRFVSKGKYRAPLVSIPAKISSPEKTRPLIESIRY